MQTQLTPNDIKDMLVIIDRATQRGVFRASDLPAISSLYVRLNDTYTQIIKSQEQQLNKAV